MDDSILNNDGMVGFATLLEATSSRLFSQGCSVTSEVMDDTGVAFSASVPPVGSRDFGRLNDLIRQHCADERFEPHSAWPLLIEVDLTVIVVPQNQQQLANFIHVLANRFLRAYEHTYFDLAIPRHRLDGRTIVSIGPDASRRLDYEPTRLDINAVVDHYLPPHPDVEQLNLGYLMASPDAIGPSWRILIDGARHFESGNLREAVLCACSAAEIAAVPAVEQWLGQSTMRRDSDAVRNAVREMGNPLRFELCVAGACTGAFLAMSQDERVDLLTELRQMNSLRNGVVHRGTEPTAAAAAAAIRAAARFTCQIWLRQLERPESH